MKRIIFSILIIFFGISLSIYLYVFLQPDQSAIYSAEIKSNEELMVKAVNVDNTEFIKEEIKSQLENEVQGFYFYSSIDNNSQYLDLNVITPLARSLNLESFDCIARIDIASIANNEYAMRDLNNEFEFNSYPVLLSISLNEDGSFNIDNILEYDESKPFSQDDIKNWMINNDCWPGPEEEAAIPIAQVEE